MDPEDESLQMHLLRGQNLTPANVQVIYKLLLENLRAKDFRSFKTLVDQSTKKQPSIIDINYVCPNGSDETFLDIACKSNLPEFVEFLLERGAKPNRVNEAHNRAPLHFATESGNVEVLRVLLNEPKINPNIEAGQQTALHMAARKNDLKVAELLLEKGASPNIPNSKGLTALHLAAMKGQENMVNLIIQKTKHALDLDSYKDYNNQTTRDVLQKKLPNIPLPPINRNRETNIHDLRYYLNANDEINFLRALEDVNVDTLNGAVDELLEIAAKLDFRNAVVKVLEKTRESARDLLKAARIAVQQGHRDILHELLKADPEIANDLVLGACLELGMPGKRGLDITDERLECLKLILESYNVDVRCEDSKGNTPLHYAARSGCREAITLLLEKGSYIGHMNKFNVPPLADIPSSTLSKYFDDCLDMKNERIDEYAIEFNYQCLVPHKDPYSAHESPKNALFDNNEKREMETLKYISKNNSLKHLLKHPLLSSFLYLKWHRIRHILYANFVFYVIFYLLLNAYILSTNYDSDSLNNTKINGTNKSNDISNENSGNWHRGNILWALTTAALFFLALREFLQLLSSPCHYISSFENWLEMALIFLGLALLNGAGPQVGAVAILLSAWELVVLIGQHPRMSTGIEMFKTVSLNFMKFLFLYAFLILAFAFAFFTLFKDKDDENFPNPARSLFKTIIMLTGEFDANDIPFVAHPILSHLVFVLFVFLIAIVLFNLLNGLAVSDTADILGKAELIGLISRIKLVAYIENVAVGAPRNYFCCRNCSSRGFCYDLVRRWRLNPLKFLAKRILLFSDSLKGGKLIVKPYDGLGNYDVKFCGGRSGLKLDSSIIKQAKDIITRKGHLSDNEKTLLEVERINDRLNTLEAVLKNVERALQNNNLNVTAKSDGN